MSQYYNLNRSMLPVRRQQAGVESFSMSYGVTRRGGQATLDSAGGATLVFDPCLAQISEPLVSLSPRVSDAADRPVIANVVSGSFTTDVNGCYTGCDIVAGRLLEVLPDVTLATIVEDLAGLILFDRTGLTGVKVDWLTF